MLAPISPISSRNSVPPLACSKRPIRRSTAPVKAPRSCPNSSGFQQGFRNGGAVYRDEGRPGTLAVLVQGPGDQFLSGAGFPANENRDRFRCRRPISL